jgi:nicotinamide riboside kinase
MKKMKLVSFSGAQSTGKTTLLNHLQHKNLDNNTVKFVPEVTRIIHREYDLPINEDAGGLTQLLINAHHVENIFQKEPEHVTVKVLDRCILDGRVYTHFLANRAHGIDLLPAYVNAVSNDLFYKLIKKYDIIFHTSPHDVKLVDDGERSINEEFRDSIIKLFDGYIASIKYTGVNIVTLTGTVEERLDQIKYHFDKYNINVNI